MKKDYFQIISICLLAISLNSCCQIFGVKYEYNENGGLRAKKSSFYKYKNDSKGDLNKLKFDGIYLRKYIGVNKNSEAFAYFRFFKSGQIHLSFLQDTYPNLKTINNLKSGIAGYFKIENEIVKIEYIHERDCGTRVLEFGKITENGLEIYSSNPKTFFGKVPENSKTEIWEFIKFEGLEKELPNW